MLYKALTAASVLAPVLATVGERADPVVLAGAPISNISVTATNVVQCSTATISWTGAADPVSLSIADGGFYVGSKPVETRDSVYGGTAQWTVTVPQGDSVQFLVRDAGNQVGYVQGIVVQPGDDWCLSGSGSGSGSGLGTGLASSAAGAGAGSSATTGAFVSPSPSPSSTTQGTAAPTANDQAASSSITSKTSKSGKASSTTTSSSSSTNQGDVGAVTQNASSINSTPSSVGSPTLISSSSTHPGSSVTSGSSTGTVPAAAANTPASSGSAADILFISRWSVLGAAGLALKLAL